MKIVFLLFIVSVMPASAQTWYAYDPSRLSEQKAKVEGDFLVTHAPIKILQPPKIASLKVAWDKITGNWIITIQTVAVLDAAYKPSCSFTFGGWSGYTVRNGDKDGASTLELVPKTYEQAITLRDALVRLHRLTPQQVTTEEKEAEKQRN